MSAESWDLREDIPGAKRKNNATEVLWAFTELHSVHMTGNAAGHKPWPVHTDLTPEEVWTLWAVPSTEGLEAKR